ncbi:unnamed protein product [Urochloa decumbens]|uniref:Uncharacterized protein n=1 Tax=Urochloa decumbens TaxID=240449 RepID=A0ABC9CJC4_9POAL
MRHAPSPAAMLLLLLLLGIELATVVTCSCRGLKPDVAAAAVAKHGGAALRVARAPPRKALGVGGGGAWAAQGESKRLVPQGPNPLHN